MEVGELRPHFYRLTLQQCCPSLPSALTTCQCLFDSTVTPFSPHQSSLSGFFLANIWCNPRNGKMSSCARWARSTPWTLPTREHPQQLLTYPSLTHDYILSPRRQKRSCASFDLALPEPRTRKLLSVRPLHTCFFTHSKYRDKPP